MQPAFSRNVASRDRADGSATLDEMYMYKYTLYVYILYHKGYDEAFLCAFGTCPDTELVHTKMAEGPLPLAILICILPQETCWKTTGHAPLMRITL